MSHSIDLNSPEIHVVFIMYLADSYKYLSTIFTLIHILYLFTFSLSSHLQICFYIFGGSKNGTREAVTLPLSCSLAPNLGEYTSKIHFDWHMIFKQFFSSCNFQTTTVCSM